MSLPQPSLHLQALDTLNESSPRGRSSVTVPDADWHSLRRAHHNVLLEGSTVNVTAMLGLLWPHLREPIVVKPARTPFELLSGQAGTVILEEVVRLSTEEQTRLLVCLDDAHSRPQIVSTSDEPVFPFVEQGRLSAALYYRLNVLLLCVDGHDSQELAVPPTGEEFARA